MKKLARILLLPLCLGLVSALPLHVALADAPPGAKLQLVVPPEATLGEEIPLEARVTDASGVGVAGVEVVFAESVSFLNAQGSVEVGRAVTDERGRATISYTPKSEGDISVSIRIAGSSSSKDEASALVKVKPGSAQHESERAGVKVPGVNMWTLALVIGGVWFIFLWAIAKVRSIFNQGQRATASQPERLAWNRGAMPRPVMPALAFATVLGISFMIGVIIIRPFTWVTPTQLSVAASGSTSYSRSEPAYIGSNKAVGWQHSPSPEHLYAADGQSYFVIYGCASCHGLNGEGSRWAPLRVSTAEQVRAMVRVGPAGMPVYPKEYLPDDVVDSIASWLVSQAATKPQTPTPVPSPTPRPTPTATTTQAVSGGASVPTPQAAGGEVSYSRDVVPIFKSACIACHGAAAMGGLNLSNYEALMTTGTHRPTIVPGNSKQSLLYLTLRGEAGKIPAMPMGVSLSQEDIEIIARWIDQGAAER